MEEEIELKRGTQIAYIPNHAEGDINHPDVEFGFIYKISWFGDAWCRYWRKGHLGELRTVANSEMTSVENIRLCNSLSQRLVDQTIEKIDESEVKE
jgi:hypothetical protein